MLWKAKTKGAFAAVIALLMVCIALAGCRHDPEVTVTGSPELDAKPRQPARFTGAPGQMPMPTKQPTAKSGPK